MYEQFYKTKDKKIYPNSYKESSKLLNRDCCQLSYKIA